MEATESTNPPTCIVTGATSGIGRATAHALAAAGARVVVVCRNRERGDEVCAEIARATGNDATEVVLADLASLASVRAAADALLERCPRIDVLVNNAGVVNTSRRESADGYEEMFAVNHLAPFLLTNLLLDRIRDSAPARIVGVASDAHKFRSLDFDDLGSTKSFGAMTTYGMSKRANILFTYELARRLEGSGVTVNCMHPGAVATGLATNNGTFPVLLTRFLSLFFRTPEKGAETVVHLATSPAVAETTGKYFYNCAEYRSDRETYDADAQRRLWEVSERLVAAN